MTSVNTKYLVLMKRVIGILLFIGLIFSIITIVSFLNVVKMINRSKLYDATITGRDAVGNNPSIHIYVISYSNVVNDMLAYYDPELTIGDKIQIYVDAEDKAPERKGSPTLHIASEIYKNVYQYLTIAIIFLSIGTLGLIILKCTMSKGRADIKCTV